LNQGFQNEEDRCKTKGIVLSFSGSTLLKPSAPHALLIIGGGIAAYKALDLIRRLKDQGLSVRCILTKGAQNFITPLAAAALSGQKACTELFDANDETQIGHIALARQADIVIVAPATANIMAKMAQGMADDLASTVLLATRAPVLIAPAMNPSMWLHKATQRNMAQLFQDGVISIGPETGTMAEDETGPGRLAEPVDIAREAMRILQSYKPLLPQSLKDHHVLITSGPTHEPLDPVRYIANRSSGKQGYALARAAQRRGARVTLITGPVRLDDPAGVDVIKVETAQQMLQEVEAALPADIAIFAAAVADWRVADKADHKIKKAQKSEKEPVAPVLKLVENPDILSLVAHRQSGRPKLVIGFAAETQDVIAHAKAKLMRKGCDLIIANDVAPGTMTFGGDENQVHIISPDRVESWPLLSKDELADRLMDMICKTIKAHEQ
jgi:phosphopantothenoylcysteine decarboxylase / phosphopantothenate---cysteine ligase